MKEQREMKQESMVYSRADWFESYSARILSGPGWEAASYPRPKIPPFSSSQPLRRPEVKAAGLHCHGY
jgi:hypothetical protein